jgi:hypothetical protein
LKEVEIEESKKGIELVEKEILGKKYLKKGV